MRSVTARFVFAVTVLGVARGQEDGGGRALFVKTTFADARQQSDPPGYLPPYSTQRPPERPRPFQTPSFASPSGSAATGYPKPSTLYSPPEVSFSSAFGLSTSYNPQPTASPSYTDFGSSTFPPFSSSTYLPPSTGYSSSPSPSYSSFGGASTNYDYSSSTFGDASFGSFSTPGGFSRTYDFSTQTPSSAAAGSSTYGYPKKSPSPPFPTPSPRPSYTKSSFQPPREMQAGKQSTSEPKPSTDSSAVKEAASTTIATDDDETEHPPHIHALDVQCSKTMMTINIEFDRTFNGVIYSKGYFANPDCLYVEQDSGQTEYSFTVSLNSCGTQFINDFNGDEGEAYLENVLVLQNEPRIQEVWDTVHKVRCLWKGNINQKLAGNFTIDMLQERLITFDGDTAVAKLDIQVGKGPFSQAANGLVKIGETMTLVVSVMGDPGFDLQVRDCFAHDAIFENLIQLTNERGCTVNSKFLGQFHKTNETGNTGASIIAYAYFEAFKFPDKMDMFIVCDVQLCKTECDSCKEEEQLDLKRRRQRSIPYVPTKLDQNASTELLSDSMRVGRGFKVIMVEDLSKASTQVLEQLEETAIQGIGQTAANICMTYTGFYLAITFILGTILATTISSAVLYVKLQRVYNPKSLTP